MIVGIVSDTHGHVSNTRQAVRMLESCEVELVIHCGDIGSADVVPLFKSWPAHFVLGNVDAPHLGLREAILAEGQTFHDRFGTLDLEGRRIAFLHGDDVRRLRSAADDGEFDLVCYGHTHEAEQHMQGRTLVVNPGALYRAQRYTIAVARLPQIEVMHVTV